MTKLVLESKGTFEIWLFGPAANNSRFSFLLVSVLASQAGKTPWRSKRSDFVKERNEARCLASSSKPTQSSLVTSSSRQQASTYGSIRSTPKKSTKQNSTTWSNLKSTQKQAAVVGHEADPCRSPDNGSTNGRQLLAMVQASAVN